MVYQTTDVWQIRESQFPQKGSIEERVRFLLRYAILAPSSHNSQPWRFALEETDLSLLYDEDAWLSVADDDRRELFISLGCALENLLTAATHFGWGTNIEYCCEDDNPTRVADVSLTPGELDRHQRQGDLLDAMVHRRTNHHPFRQEPLDPEDKEALMEDLENGGIEYRWITEKPDVETLCALNKKANQQQFSNPEYRRELGLWIGRGAFGDSWLKARIGQLFVTYFDLGGKQSSDEEELMQTSSAFLVLATPEDTRQAQLQVGRLYQRLGLLATKRGVAFHPMSASLEVPETRRELAEVLDVSWPQHLFRLGYPTRSEDPSPRRPLESVLIPGT